jgi:arylsulfatase A-like enzyme
VDLAPTILDLTGVNSEVLFDGRSLLGPMSGQKLEERSIYIESFNNLKPPQIWLAVVSGRWKLLRQRSKGIDELYDLAEDPGELRDVSSLRPEVLEGLRGQAAEFAASGTW